ncbi:ParB-like partition nuclease [Vibrio phage eugene 12A10]|uniref:ParB-like partition nuclease n=1 Tax=Vibrio phage eugene 12A10 TaxID=573172 RepID=UPI000351EBBA|nr:ParB-like partition nuclease [Vibrio phage eugene 12A10]AGN51597.1 hypothetical protein VPLG_00158 [Vibrio phage eugene 12A10]
MITLEIDKIVVENRFRKSVGDLDPLIRSIESLGLLQPIGVDSDNYLVYGERRLRACSKIGWKDIPVVVVDCHPLKAERDENEERKPFTVEEKVLLAEAISKGLSGRHGGNRSTSDKQDGEFSVLKKGETREIAAVESGLGSSATLRQAKKVIESGEREVIDQMNSGEISINKAHTKIKEKLTPSKPKPEVVKPSLDLNITICIEIEGHKIELTKEKWMQYVDVIQSEISEL